MSSTSPDTLDLAMGCFELRLSSREPELVTLARDRYGSIVARDERLLRADSALQIELDLCFDDTLDLRDPTRFQLVRNDAGIHITSGALDGRLDRVTGRGHVALPDPSRPGVAAGLPAMALENFLRISLAILAPEADCLLVHTAAVTRRDHPSAVLLHGPSGAGKSTAAALSAARDPRHRVLTDDLLLVGVPSGGLPLAHATCFWGDERPRPRPGAALPIAGIFELHQSHEHEAAIMESGEGAASLIAAVPFQGFMSGDEVRRALDLAIEVTSRVPCSRLHFRKDAEFWDAVEGMLA